MAPKLLENRRERRKDTFFPVESDLSLVCNKFFFHNLSFYLFSSENGGALHSFVDFTKKNNVFSGVQ